jgi:hypothetical protein
MKIVNKKILVLLIPILFQLIACDSDSSSCVVGVLPPVAYATTGQSNSLGSMVGLDGSGSFDPEGCALAYSWNITSKPEGSLAELNNGFLVNPTFIADKLGQYTAELSVFDGEFISNVSTVEIYIDTEILYHNDFDSGSDSLDDFELTEDGPAFISVQGGELKISTGLDSSGSGIASIHLPSVSPGSESILSNNPAIFRISFTVSNLDSSVCGACNNMFYVGIYNTKNINGNERYGYRLNGGGYVGDRMIFIRDASFDSPYGNVYEELIDINDGLPNFPMRGSFRLEFDPTSNTWALYFQRTPSDTEPTEIIDIVGSAVDGEFAEISLPYISFGTDTGDSAYFDNITIDLKYVL